MGSISMSQSLSLSSPPSKDLTIGSREELAIVWFPPLAPGFAVEATLAAPEDDAAVVVKGLESTADRSSMRSRSGDAEGCEAVTCCEDEGSDGEEEVEEDEEMGSGCKGRAVMMETKGRTRTRAGDRMGLS